MLNSEQSCTKTEPHLLSLSNKVFLDLYATRKETTIAVKTQEATASLQQALFKEDLPGLLPVLHTFAPFVVHFIGPDNMSRFCWSTWSDCKSQIHGIKVYFSSPVGQTFVVDAGYRSSSSFSWLWVFHLNWLLQNRTCTCSSTWET